MALPELHKYVRQFVVSYPIQAPNYSGPDYDSVVEAWFDTMEDLNGYYLAESRMKTVEPDHENFMYIMAFGGIVAEEDVVVG